MYGVRVHVCALNHILLICNHVHTTGYYNEFYLKYLHFVHSLCLLETLLLYRGGRELFPVTMKGREGWYCRGLGEEGQGDVWP